MQLCRSMWIGAATLSIVLLAAGAAVADVLSIPASKDNTLYEDPAGALSNGAGEHFFAGTNAEGKLRRGLIKFDAAAYLPAGATIHSAALFLNCTQTVSGNTTVSLHRVLADWGEGLSHASGMEGGGATATTGDATWLHAFYDTVPWTTMGGDFDPDESAAIIVNATDAYSWSSAAMATDVQAWLDLPAGNFGWMLRGDEGTSRTAKRFDSLSATTMETRPILTIDFTPIPESGLLGLPIFAGALLTRRRAR